MSTLFMLNINAVYIRCVRTPLCVELSPSENVQSEVSTTNRMLWMTEASWYALHPNSSGAVRGLRGLGGSAPAECE